MLILPLELDRIDDVERARLLCDGDHDAPVLGDRDVVGPAAERDFLGELAGLLVEDVERVVGLVADIDPGTVRREGDAVRGLDAFEPRYHLVGGGIDHVDVVAAAVGGIDTNCICRSRLCGEGKQCETVRRSTKGELRAWYFLPGNDGSLSG